MSIFDWLPKFRKARRSRLPDHDHPPAGTSRSGSEGAAGTPEPAPGGGAAAQQSGRGQPGDGDNGDGYGGVLEFDILDGAPEPEELVHRMKQADGATMRDAAKAVLKICKESCGGQGTPIGPIQCWAGGELGYVCQVECQCDGIA